MHRTFFKRSVAFAAMIAGLTIAAGLTVTPTVQAASWLSDPEINIPEPIDPGTGQKLYVPFNQVLGTVGKNTESPKVLTGLDGTNVAALVTKDKVPHQSGAIWSIEPISLTQPFSSKMHIYFGTNTEPADGMAFALTGGARPTRPYDDGAGLGVWQLNTGSTPGALPRSFAIVFDPYKNADWLDKNVTYPADSKKQYVGWGFPGQTDYQYTRYAVGENLGLVWGSASSTSGLDSLDNKATHKGLGGYQALTAGQQFNDGKWHTVTIDWKPDAATDGGGTIKFEVELTDGTFLKKQLTWTKAQSQAIFGGTNVYWGFTGSTGENFEDAIVTFETIPGLVSASAQAAIKAPNDEPAPSAVYRGTRLKQVYTVTYNGDQSKQDWPVQDANNGQNLAFQMKTDNHYGFVVDSTGKVPVTLTAPGHAYPRDGLPVGPLASVRDRNGHVFQVAHQITVAGLSAFQKRNHGQTYTVSAPIMAATTTAPDAVLTGQDAGAIIGNNAHISATVDVPAVIEPPLSLSVPARFNFGNLSVAQFVTGFTVPGRVTDDQGIEYAGGIAAQIPSDAKSSLTAQMTTSFPLGSGYHPEQTVISFDYNNQTIKLQDGAPEPTTLFQNATVAPPASINNLLLTMGKYPAVKKGHYEATITWTLTVAPPDA